MAGARSAKRGGGVVRLRALRERLSGVTVELRRGSRVVARTGAVRVGSRSRAVVLRRRRGARFVDGSYSLVVRARGKVLLRRGVRLG